MKTSKFLDTGINIISYTHGFSVCSTIIYNSMNTVIATYIYLQQLSPIPKYRQEINKNLKFKKGVGIAIKSQETSSKLAI